MSDWPTFLRVGLAQAERELSEAEALAEFYGRRAAKLRAEVHQARDLIQKLDTTPAQPPAGERGGAG